MSFHLMLNGMKKFKFTDHISEMSTCVGSLDEDLGQRSREGGTQCCLPSPVHPHSLF